MRIILPCLLSLLLCPGLCGQGGGKWDLLGAVGEDKARIPSLEDLFLDISALLGRADPVEAETLRGRLEWTNRRIGVLNRLRQQVRAGLSVEIPVELLSPVIPGASSTMLERVQQEAEGLRARHALAKVGAERKPAARVMYGADTFLSTFGMAVLYIEQELPLPPQSAAGSVESVGSAASREDLGKSLQRVGDFQGALNAFLAIKDTDRSLAVWYRMGQCSERLGRWRAAELYYQKLVEIAPDRIWGKMASQRLEFGRKKNDIGKRGKDAK